MFSNGRCVLAAAGASLNLFFNDDFGSLGVSSLLDDRAAEGGGCGALILEMAGRRGVGGTLLTKAGGVGKNKSSHSKATVEYLLSEGFGTGGRGAPPGGGGGGGGGPPPGGGGGGGGPPLGGGGPPPGGGGGGGGPLPGGGGGGGGPPPSCGGGGGGRGGGGGGGELPICKCERPTGGGGGG